MSQLIDFQAKFVANLIAGTSLDPAMGVYRNTILLGAVDALADNFPVVRTLVGDDCFQAMAIAFAQLHPPKMPVLATYGCQFPVWLQQDDISQELPYLADVASCERLWVKSMHAEDAEPLEPSQVSQLDPDQLLHPGPNLHPAAQFAWLETPAIDIWLAHQDGEPGDMALDWRATGALFTRPVYATKGVAIDAAAYCLLCSLSDAKTIAEAMGDAASLYPTIDIGACFAGLIRQGAITVPPTKRKQS